MAKPVQMNNSQLISDKEIDEIKQLIFQIAKTECPSIVTKNDVVSALNSIQLRISQNEKEAKEKEERLSNIIDVITSLAKLEYDKKAYVSNQKNYFDALALGVNMLGEELQASTISLHEKEVLLKEIHHRVKNNLQVISSLLNLQAEYIHDADALEKFKESQNRVRSMALVHEKLYESQNLSQVNFAEYINKFINVVYDSNSIQKGQVKLHLNFIANECQLPIDIAIPCALILNELVTNVFKYAFPNKGTGNLYLNFYKKESEQFVIEVSDDGIGLPQNFDIKKVTSLGLQLVEMLVEQIEGEVCVQKVEAGGTKFVISFFYKQ